MASMQAAVHALVVTTKEAAQLIVIYLFNIKQSLCKQLSLRVCVCESLINKIICKQILMPLLISVA